MVMNDQVRSSLSSSSATTERTNLPEDEAPQQDSRSVSPLDSSAAVSAEEDDYRSETSTETTFSQSSRDSASNRLLKSGAPASSSYANHRDLATRMKRVIRQSVAEETTPVVFDEHTVGTDLVLSVPYEDVQDDKEDKTSASNQPPQYKKFYVHRFMLAASSEPFRAMLACPMREALENEVVMRDITPDIVEKMLWYIYTGEVTLLVEDVLSILLAAEMYELQGLSEICKTFVLHHAHEVFRDGQITRIPEKLLLEMIQDDELQIREVVLMEALVTWGEAHLDKSDPTSNMVTLLDDLMQQVRFPTMSVSDLYGKVRPLVRQGIVREALLTEALFYHLKWGTTSSCPAASRRMRPRALAAALRKRKRVSFIQHVSFVTE